MIRALSVGTLLLAAVILVPMMMDGPVEAAPPTLHPGVPGEPGEELPECPWHASIDIVDCETGVFVAGRMVVISSQGQCSSAIQELTALATSFYNECVGGSSCIEYRWCED